jgi:hypothetical protein
MKPGDLVKIYPTNNIALVLEVDLKDPLVKDRVIVLCEGRQRLIFKALLEVINETW